MKIVGLIPARYQSSRFPGKPLAELLGKPMILHVAALTAEALGNENAYVATDDDRIANVVTEAGFQVVMTDSTALTGTDRLWQAAQQIEADVYINVQGDEPIVNPADIRKVADAKIEMPDKIINGMYPISADEDPSSVNIPKVIFNEAGQMVYMSRLPIPGYKSEKNKPETYYKQVCIYGFSYADLEAFGTFGRKGTLEAHEDIEILRFVEIGTPIQMVMTSCVSLAVDVPDDIPIVEAAMKEMRDA